MLPPNLEGLYKYSVLKMVSASLEPHYYYPYVISILFYVEPFSEYTYVYDKYMLYNK